MPVQPGARLGPYEVLAPLGAGGMGEVYRARDTRLARDVAIKVLPPGSVDSPDRRHRIESEARATGQLTHPNILAIYDIGTHDGSPFLVTELLEGETLRARLDSGPLAVRKAVEFAIQVAKGLAAAHEKGIVHRDLKPENLFVIRDERIKILDFGLAKLLDQESSPAPDVMPTVIRTETGMVLGTAGYMSPEQVRARPVDHRSDIFNLGAILFEMVAGRRAFPGASIGEAMSAVLKDEPPALALADGRVPPGLDMILQRCLEKERDARWQTAHDLAFALEALLATAPTVSTPVMPETGASPWRRAALARAAVAALALAAVAMLAGLELGKRLGVDAPLAFQRLTFSRGTIWSARFAHEGRTIIYSAGWDGNPVGLYSTRTDGPESRSLETPAADVLAISSAGEMALLLKSGSAMEWNWKWGTLARVPLAGGSPRGSMTGVQLADWAADGASLAVVRAANGRSRVEFPAGTLLYETPDRIGAMRVSRAGDRVCFAERPAGLGGGWAIGTLDSKGQKRTISTGWAGDFIDLAWSPSDDEIWFTTRQGGDNGVHAVNLAGRHRLLAQMGFPAQLFDVALDGRALMARAYWRSGIIGLPPGENRERDLSWLDGSELDDISHDGKTLLMTEFGEGGGVGRGSVYVRNVDGSPAVRLGDGQGFAFSPDGTRALGLRRGSPPELVLWPTGAGEPIVLKNATIKDYIWADWLPDGKRIFFSGTETGHAPRSYLQSLDGGPPLALTPEGTGLVLGQKVISPDGGSAAVIGTDGRAMLYPLDGGQPRSLPGLEPGDVPIRWRQDERALFVFRKSEATPRMYVVDLSTGENTLWRDLMPADPIGVVNVWGTRVGPDERSYYYSYMRTLSDLYLVVGLK
jgi:serine/threonine protein kinase/Tol biopolymer transport system component